MKTTGILMLAMAASLSLTAPQPLNASAIENACNSSGRKAANRALCGCIQDAADMILTRSDQRKAAKFFKDPHQAQVIRQSSKASDERFWLRYKEFGQTAETFCSS
ncbi:MULTISPECIES: hypothetical protein [Halocynthiibacter]|uniref:Arginine transporter n=1 Tax=Halocynthiibacter halioticoli TaxID=2986804 RepID=A0AAE3IZZ0_9RHOB|nr:MULTISPECIES: hypothetical protein [Halocynthiibacter]MCV6825213.1 hypothetical protein [Halocynthiibacter halioticoli]MCW4058214.1 hypothetical protein [Halocynthiibacter sp. SDUM655004]MDE0588765.1 hypothetical protein [Halocynthiibacter sp. C4]